MLFIHVLRKVPTNVSYDELSILSYQYKFSSQSSDVIIR